MVTSEKNGSKNLQKSYFDVLGLCCSSEVHLIEKILKPLDGVKDVTVIIPSRTVIVVHDTLLLSQVQIVKVLNKARLEANVRVVAEGRSYRKKWPSPFAIACGVLLLLSFLRYLYHPLQWLAIGAVAVGIYPVVLKCVAALRNFTLDINTLMLIAVVGSIVLHDYWEAGTIVFLFTTAEWLEARASYKATAVMSSLANIVPQSAVLAETGEEVNVAEVKLNSILAIKAGDIIPIDGIVVEGSCEVDEKTLTGESFPVSKQKECIVWAGTLNLNGYISIKTTAIAEECVVARMAKLVEEAQKNKSRTQRFIDKCSKYYTPAIVAISACLAVIPAALKLHNRSQWYHLALVVLVTACPCALILSTPVATFCALSKAATSGLLIKGAEYLETLAKVKIMAFDKTGTITTGEFIVTDFRSLVDDVSMNTLLYWVASIESKSSHPMAAALIDYGHSNSIEPKPDKVEEFENFSGEGIYGKIDGHNIYIGNRKIATRSGCATVPNLEGSVTEGKSVGYIFVESSPAGFFSLSDVCRTGVKEAIKELKLMGIKSAMLTGDCQAAANCAQDQIGGAFDVIHAELLPEDKARIIKDFQKEKPTAMIGDGLNDALALSTADIGISMGISGSALATEAGQVILMSNDIRKIPQALRLARRTQQKVIQNVILSVTLKAAVLVSAIAGHPIVWVAVLTDVGTCLLVILNSMLLLQEAPIYVNKSCKSSAANHSHKHRCKTDVDHVSHTRKHCCSHIEAENNCKPKNCSSNMNVPNCHSVPFSSSSCSNTKCSDSADKDGHSIGKNQLCKGENLDHGKCGMFIQDTKSHTVHKNSCSSHSSCCEKDKSVRSVEVTDTSAVDDEIYEVKHCENMASQRIHNELDCCGSSSKQVHDMPIITHCNVKCCRNDIKNQIKDEELRSIVKTCVKNCQKNKEVQSEIETQATECGSIHTNLSLDVNHVECKAIKGCASLEKRQFGDCCKSFRKECCGKSGHFGSSIGGGLSEIIIE